MPWSTVPIDGAVLGRLVVEIVRSPDGGRARHVDRDHRWPPGKVTAEMRGNEAAVGIVAAADRVADQTDGLALGRSRHAAALPPCSAQMTVLIRRVTPNFIQFSPTAALPASRPNTALRVWPVNDG